MTDSFVTQCPHCQTRFRVNHAQLSVARGVVRCGSCLQVFNAARQLLEQRAQAPAPEPEQQAAPPAPRTISQKQWAAEALDLDNLDLDEELAKLERREIQHTQTTGVDRRQPGSDRRQKEEPLSASRDTIKAEEEKKEALAKLTAAEAKLAQLETEKEGIISKAKAEAEAEKQRLAEHTQAKFADIGRV